MNKYKMSVKRAIGCDSKILDIKTESGLNVRLWSDVQLGTSEADLDTDVLKAVINGFIYGKIDEFVLRACMNVNSFLVFSDDEPGYRISLNTLEGNTNVCSVSVPVSTNEMHKILTDIKEFFTSL